MNSNHSQPVVQTETLRVWDTEVERGLDIYGQPQLLYITESEELISGKWEHFVALKY